jgi:hypothetical protein
VTASARLLHITFAAGSGPVADQSLVQYVIDTNAVDWMRYATYSYIIWTQMELAAWTALLRTIPNMENGYFFICAIDPEAPIEGFLPKWSWDWLFKYRGHSPAPPPPKFPSLPPSDQKLPKVSTFLPPPKKPWEP